MKVAVVTPTIGSEHLTQCLQSVQNQTYENLVHYIFIDGEEYFNKILMMGVKNQDKKQVKTIALQDNIGKGWYGHRVYAACSFLVNADVICYLDEDNWYDPEHVEKLVAKINEGNQWSYSLRKIYDKKGDFVCEDNCESLGKWPVYFNGNTHHIDTSSFAIRRDIAVHIGHSWYGQWGADRQFYQAIKKYFPSYDCTGSYSLCYRLDGNPNSVTDKFFIEGNEVQKNKYKDGYPWLKNNQQIGPGITLIS
jgi:glycosyltransferase involved in cell wall biosynthesis